MQYVHHSENNALERIPTLVFTDEKRGSLWAAEQIIEQIRASEQEKGFCTLALPTGSTPVKVYEYLVDFYQKGQVSFRNAHVFMLDEYFPISPDNRQSFYYFLQTRLCGKVDLPADHFHHLRGDVPVEEVREQVQAYEQAIQAFGGIDLMLLGIGDNGHIAFNEPGSHVDSTTRRVVLSSRTRLQNARYFTDQNVPYTALSMGIGTILASKKILLMAFSKTKAEIIRRTVEEKVTDEVPASALQLHANARVVLDLNTSVLLTRFQAPWLGGYCDWNMPMMKKAIVKMALDCKKPILSLTQQDYEKYGLQDLVVYKKDVFTANLEVFYSLRDSITGWPGGKPSPLPNHPERSSPFPKKVLIFSPHPDDDIISMGGTFMRLHDQGHEVHVAYQTSGNIAVTDEFVLRFLDFSLAVGHELSQPTVPIEQLIDEAKTYIANKRSIGARDSLRIRTVRGLIRRCEARAACRYVGIPEERIHFQNLPFYESGTIEKKPVGEQDIRQTIDLLNLIQPQQIYCAGDLSDPHGTHKTCLDIITQAIYRLQQSRTPWLEHCWVWMYKGAWQEWDIDEIEMAVPMSPDQLLKKRFGIFIHQSQKDIVPFQGEDKREFWQRAEDRNRNTANLYAALGLTHYTAIEGFVRWHF